MEQTTGWQRGLAWLTLDRLVVGLVFMLIFAVSCTIGFESDSWWNLRSGQLIWDTRQVWHTDPFSSTAFGAYWPNHEWLTQIILYGTYILSGLRGIQMLCAVIITSTWIMIYRLCEGPARLRALLILLGSTTHAIHWAIRPHILTLLLMVTLLTLLRRRNLHRWIPLLFLIWANLHGGVAMGGLLLFLAAIAGIVSDRQDTRHWLLLTLISGAVTVITPMGTELWQFTVSMLNHPETRYIQEWLPPSLAWPISYPFFILAALWVVLVVRSWRQLWAMRNQRDGFWPLLLLIAGTVFFVLSLRAIRHTLLFTLVALPLITYLSLRQLQASTSPKHWRLGLLHGGIGLGVTAASLVFVRNTWRNPTHWQPLSTNLIAAVRACPGTLYNTYDVGGTVMWFIPERPVFVDSRNDPYSLDILFGAVEAEQQGTYHELFAQYDVSCALVTTNRAIYAALSSDSAWREIYSDADRAVFTRQDIADSSSS